MWLNYTQIILVAYFSIIINNNIRVIDKLNCFSYKFTTIFCLSNNLLGPAANKMHRQIIMK